MSARIAGREPFMDFHEAEIVTQRACEEVLTHGSRFDPFPVNVTIPAGGGSYVVEFRSIDDLSYISSKPFYNQLKKESKEVVNRFIIGYSKLVTILEVMGNKRPEFVFSGEQTSRSEHGMTNLPSARQFSEVQEVVSNSTNVSRLSDIGQEYAFQPTISGQMDSGERHNIRVPVMDLGGIPVGNPSSMGQGTTVPHSIAKLKGRGEFTPATSVVRYDSESVMPALRRVDYNEEYHARLVTPDSIDWLAVSQTGALPVSYINQGQREAKRYY